jgi:hypothetical protein
LGSVWLPHALERKYPNAAGEWGWQYVFPAAEPHDSHQPTLPNPICAQVPSANSPKRLVDKIQLDATIVSKLAATLAAALANNEAKKRFDAEPFSPSAAPATLHGDRWEWQAIVSHGKGDLQAAISFKQDGSEPKVAINQLVNELKHSVEQ